MTTMAKKPRRPSRAMVGSVKERHAARSGRLEVVSGIFFSFRLAKDTEGETEGIGGDASVVGDRGRQTNHVCNNGNVSGTLMEM